MTQPDPAIKKPKQRRGFSAMDPAKRKLIAAKGGGSVPAHKRAFYKDRDLAAAAGSKGGEASRGGGRGARKQDASA
jgi:general stress protein YciG